LKKAEATLPTSAAEAASQASSACHVLQEVLKKAGGDAPQDGGAKGKPGQQDGSRVQVG
jgi:hypothetical protein